MKIESFIVYVTAFLIAFWVGNYAVMGATPVPALQGPINDYAILLDRLAKEYRGCPDTGGGDF